MNGGLVEVHYLEAAYKNISIKNEAFQNIFDFFDEWDWRLDTRVTASGRDINPDVIGYIFEKYINNRADMGMSFTHFKNMQYERAILLANNKSFIGFIIPVASVCTD